MGSGRRARGTTRDSFAKAVGYVPPSTLSEASNPKSFAMKPPAHRERTGSDAIHHLLKLVERKALHTVAERILGRRVHLDNDSVRPRRDRGTSQSRNELGLATSRVVTGNAVEPNDVGRIPDNRVPEALHDRNGTNIAQ